jgi:hypothetical protein
MKLGTQVKATINLTERILHLTPKNETVLVPKGMLGTVIKVDDKPNIRKVRFDNGQRVWVIPEFLEEQA